MTEPVKRKRGRPRKNPLPDVRAPLRDALREDMKEFVYRPDDETDRLKIPPHMIPQGMDYLWVTASIYGQPQPQRLARFQKQGWVPVPASRHDGMFMPKGHDGYIEVDGLILHERPLKISDMARAYELNKARGQIKAKERQLLGGQIDGVSLDTTHQSALKTNRINKTYEEVEIPEE